MEQQFILRLHESIRHVVDLKECTIDMPDGQSAVLTHKTQRYPGIVVRLPCIVESQKSMDSKQYYKIADTSTLVAIYPDESFDLDREREILELSGLSAPLRYVKARRFRKKSSRGGYAEEIEKRVCELLEKDMRARSVEIVTRDEKELSEELDMFAAEIENKLAEREESVETVPEHVEAAEPQNAEVEGLERAIEEKRTQMENALNPILQKRFEMQLNGLRKDLEELRRRLGE